MRLDQFLRAGYNSVRKSQGAEELDVLKFNRLLKGKVALIGVDSSLVQRYVNEGFSGGERKRNEVLQMAVMEPKLAILDEPDSGLDIDAVRVVAEGINQLRAAQRGNYTYHPLPAYPQLRGPGRGARVHRRPDREDRWQRAGPAGGGGGLR